MILTLLLAAYSHPGLAAPSCGDLSARYRSGQTFLTWSEPPGLTGVRFQVRLHERPITEANVAAAQIAGDFIRPASATDWWLNPETYGAPLEPGPDGAKHFPEPQGWLLDEGGTRLDPQSGLFVHTVTPETAGARYYAVLAFSDGTGERADEIAPGVNSLAEPVTQSVAPVQPIWQGDPATKPDFAARPNLPLDLVLHAKRGRGGMEWLAFGSADLGWSDGLPFKFGAQVRGDSAIVTPTDRTWIGRLLTDDRDECQRLTPAIHTFWFGYNDRVFDPQQMPEGRVVNFTERRLLWIIDWAQRTFGTDPSRTYCTGSSMGGCGTMSFAFRHPEVFAACSANVPIVAYDKGPGGDSEFRLSSYTGGLAAPCEGSTVGERLDSTRFVLSATADLPFLVLANGRSDASIPWWKNPAFYRALDARRQGFVAAWNEGTHGEVEAQLPPDLRERMSLAWLHRFALDRSYLAFSNSSADADPGNGDKENGDSVGYMNRGLDFEVLADEPGRYEARVLWYLDPAQLPATVDVTPRRVQGMKWKPGDVLTAAIAGAETVRRDITVDDLGLATITAVELRSPDGVRIELRRPGD
jgi:hypothetical protein